MKPLNRPMFKMGGLIKEGIMDGIREPKAMGGIGGGNFMGTPMGNRMGYRTTFKPIGTTTGVAVPTTGAATPGFQFLEPGLQQEIMKQERARIKPPKPTIEQRIVDRTKGIGSKINPFGKGPVGRFVDKEVKQKVEVISKNDSINRWNSLVN